jgi:undecaprenyl-diphosphatase
MTPFDAGLLGIVEGVSEFLPISSTGHLILASTLLGLQQTDIQKTFEIVIQLGAILAVVVYYWRRFFDIELIKKLVVAFIPTGLVGFLVYPFFKAALNGNLQVVVWSLILGGIVLIFFERFKREDSGTIESLSYAQCAQIGLIQSIAIIPGVSRSAATIVGGELLGMSRVAVVEFSFLLAVPTMLAATGYDLLKQAHAFSSADFGLLAIGGIAAFVVALGSIHWLLSFVRTHGFSGFGIYRIAVGLVFLIFVLGV